MEPRHHRTQNHRGQKRSGKNSRDHMGTRLEWCGIIGCVMYRDGVMGNIITSQLQGTQFHPELPLLSFSRLSRFTPKHGKSPPSANKHRNVSYPACMPRTSAESTPNLDNKSRSPPHTHLLMWETKQKTLRQPGCISVHTP